MSAILAAFGPVGSLPDDAIVRRMLTVMRRRGTEAVEVHREERAVLAVGRYRWEMDSGAHSGTLVAARGGIVVAADASLYYRSDLAARLDSAGVAVHGDSPAELILAAYDAWGERCLTELEGDYAFVVWDRRVGRVLGARDYYGTRPLYYAIVRDTLVVASSVAAIRQIPGCPDDLNLVAIAEAASLFLGASHETAYRDIRSVGVGDALRFGIGDRAPSIERVWHAPRFSEAGSGGPGFSDAARELRSLLEAASAERMPAGDPVAVTLSGGWDSPSVYAAAHAARGRSGRDTVLPVSVSFPPGDMGREDELIERIAGHYGQSPVWLKTAEIPLFWGGFVRSAVEADEPLVHVYASFNRALGRGSRRVGARVALDGVGGDHLFHAEPSFFSDLLRRGRVLQLWSQAGAEGFRHWGGLRQWAVMPLVGPDLLRLLRPFGSRAPGLAFLERALPRWIDARFAEEQGMRERERAGSPRRRWSDDAEGYERRWMIEHPFYARMSLERASLFLEEGVEQRSPLFDQRVLRFAASRPRRERRSDRETKRLLRAAVADLLPADVLAPRAQRTGTTLHYLGRSLREQLPRLATPFFAEPVLADLGIVDADRLRAQIDRIAQGRIDPNQDATLITALHTEIWARSRLGAPFPDDVKMDVEEEVQVVALA